MTIVVDITVPSNVDFRREFAVVDDDGLSRADLYLSRLFFHARTTYDAPLISLQASTDPRIGGLQILAPIGAGRFVMFFPAAALKRAGAGAFVHDLIEVTPLLIRRRLWRGTFTIEQGVTR